MHKGYTNADGEIVKLPHRVSEMTIKKATEAGKKSESESRELIQSP
jgi:hypothetical protein